MLNETADKAAEEEAEEAGPLEKAQKEIEELKTQLLYKVAELDNYRKRTLKERAELILNGGENSSPLSYLSLMIWNAHR